MQDAIIKGEEESGGEPMPVQPFKFYARNIDATYKIVETRWVQFCLLGGVLYLYHLIWTMAGVNAFSS